MENILSVKNLSKKYGSKVALDDVNIDLTGGKIVGLLGPNGSGKTTLIKLIMGLLTPNSGEIKVCDENVSHITKGMISYLPDNLYFDRNSKVSSVLNIFEDFYEDFDRQKCINMLEDHNITGNPKLKELSKGMLEKVQLSLVLSRNSKLFVLDEPLGAVDPAARDKILNTIMKNYSKTGTMLISTHLIQDVEDILDEVIFIKNGKILLHENAKKLRERENSSINDIFREVFKC